MSDFLSGSVLARGAGWLKRLYLESWTCRVIGWTSDPRAARGGEPSPGAMDPAGGSLFIRSIQDSRICRWTARRFKEESRHEG